VYGWDLFVDPAKVYLLSQLSNGDWITFDDVIHYSLNFVNSSSKCTSDQMRSFNGGNNIYERMFSTFNSSLGDVLTYSINNNPGNDWCQTYGSSYNNSGTVDFYRITIDDDIENSSNLSKEVTLLHELIHAYFFDTLHEAGFATFTDNSIFLNGFNCNDEFNGVNLLTLTTAEEYRALLCAMNESGILNTTEWTHEIFNVNAFSTNTLQQEIQNFLLSYHDWDGENTAFKAFLQNTFGNQWKQKSAEFISWTGLEATQEFQSFANQNNYLETNGNLNNLYISIAGSMLNLGNKNCN